jgi:hypothetical protein
MNLDHLTDTCVMGTNNLKKSRCMYSETWILRSLNLHVPVFCGHI